MLQRVPMKQTASAQAPPRGGALLYGMGDMPANAHRIPNAVRANSRFRRFVSSVRSMIGLARSSQSHRSQTASPHNAAVASWWDSKNLWQRIHGVLMVPPSILSIQAAKIFRTLFEKTAMAALP